MLQACVDNVSHYFLFYLGHYVAGFGGAKLLAQVVAVAMLHRASVQ